MKQKISPPTSQHKLLKSEQNKNFLIYMSKNDKKLHPIIKKEFLHLLIEKHCKE